jgi:hypothetical protein
VATRLEEAGELDSVAGGVNDRIDALGVPGSHGVQHVLGVVDGLIGTKVRHVSAILGGGGGDNRGSAGLGELHGKRADTTSGTGDQDGLAWPRVDGVDGEEGCGTGEAQGSGASDRESIWDLGGERRLGGDEF